jgi:hypothetical protein
MLLTAACGRPIRPGYPTRTDSMPLSCRVETAFPSIEVSVKEAYRA